MKGSTSQPPVDLGQARQGFGRGARLPDALRNAFALARDELAARFGPVEWVLLAILVVLPVALAWRFASPSFFFLDDLGHLYWAQHSQSALSYAFDPAWGHLAPAYRLTYLGVGPARADELRGRAGDPRGLSCGVGRAASAHPHAGLRPRVVDLRTRAGLGDLGRLPAAVRLVRGGIHSIPAITATLASIHGYLCWRRQAGGGGWRGRSWRWSSGWASTKRRCLSRSIWCSCASCSSTPRRGCVTRCDRSGTSGGCGSFTRWCAASSCSHTPLVPISGRRRPRWARSCATWASSGSRASRRCCSASRVPQYGQTGWDQIVIVAAQVVLIGLVVWSVAQRRAAWRAWAFLLIAVIANMLILMERVCTARRGDSRLLRLLLHRARPVRGAGNPVRVRCTAAPARVAAVESSAPAQTVARWYGVREPATGESSFRLPTMPCRRCGLRCTSGIHRRNAGDHGILLQALVGSAAAGRDRVRAARACVL